MILLLLYAAVPSALAQEAGTILTIKKAFRPLSLAIDAQGRVLFSDLSTVKRINADNTETTVAGTGGFGGSTFSGDGGPATQARLSVVNGLATDLSGNLFIADTDNRRIRKVDTSGIITTVAGNGGEGTGGEGGPALQAELGRPWGVAVDPTGQVFVTDWWNERVGKIGPDQGFTVLKKGAMPRPRQLALDREGNLYFPVNQLHEIWKLSPDGAITVVAGSRPTSGEGGFSGDGGPATAARLNNPYGVAVDSQGNLFIADRENYRIRKVDPQGIITTVAGNGQNASTGNGGPASSASISDPMSLAIDASGNLLIAEATGNLRKIERAAAPGLIAGQPFPTQIKAGDVNGDSGVDVADAVLVLQAAVQIRFLTPEQAQAADVVKDGRVDVSDAVKILRVVTKLDPGF